MRQEPPSVFSEGHEHLCSDKPSTRRLVPGMIIMTDVKESVKLIYRAAVETSNNLRIFPAVYIRKVYPISICY